MDKDKETIDVHVTCLHNKCEEKDVCVVYTLGTNEYPEMERFSKFEAAQQYSRFLEATYNIKPKIIFDGSLVKHKGSKEY